MKQFKEHKKIYLSKTKIEVIDYCKHGNLITTNRILAYSGESKNLCLECSMEIQNEILNTNINYLKEYSEVIKILRDPIRKISKDKLLLWYPYLYKKIDSLDGKYWREKIYMFLNEIVDKPECSCGGIIVFNNKKNKYKEKCEECNRSEALKKDSREKSEKKWRQIFMEDFNIQDPIFKVKDKFHIEISINDKIAEFRKKDIHHLRKDGILSVDSIEKLSPDQIAHYSEIFKLKWEKFKNLSEEQIKSRYPFIWKTLNIINREQFQIEDFNELKYLVKNDLKIPECSICHEKVSFSRSNQRYNINCEKHKFMVFSSSQEQEIYDFIKEIYEDPIIRNFRSKNMEIDIYIPDLKLGIEFNGLYWHSEKYKAKDYHYKKKLYCSENEINLLTIWEDDWKNKKNIIKSIIKNKLGKTENRLYARKGKVQEINYYETKEFLDQNHLQANCSSSVNIGLFYNNELMSLMTFGGRKISGKKQYELLRFCNKIDHSIIGASSKLFKYFLNNYSENNIISYSNLDLFNGNIYEKLGFNKLHHTGINYWWVKDGIRYNRNRFMKYKLIEKGADPNKTGDEIMRDLGYFKIHGSGNIKWVF